MAPESSFVFLHYLTTVFDDIGDGVILVTIEPHFTYRLTLANKPFLSLSGYPEHWVGKTLNEVIAPENFRFIDRSYRRVIRSREAYQYTRWFTLPSGRRALHVKLLPILNGLGDCVHIAAIAQDVTETVRLRQTLADQHKLLQKAAAGKR